MRQAQSDQLAARFKKLKADSIALKEKLRLQHEEEMAAKEAAKKAKKNTSRWGRAKKEPES